MDQRPGDGDRVRRGRIGPTRSGILWLQGTQKEARLHSGPLTLDRLRGRVVLFGFWTYG
jgi:hypothetical protein